MNPRERGFLLLGSQLGDPERRPLSPAQMRTLSQRICALETPEKDRDMDISDLLRLGYREEMARRILSLLGEDDRLDAYLREGAKRDCVPLTRLTNGYPQTVHSRLGPEAPCCLWAKGDLSILNAPAVSLVGSRELREENRAFARAVGRQAARQGYALVSGNARGADRVAQNAALEAGGQVISIVADELWKQPLQKNTLYLSEEGFDESFSPRRALSRNRCIHAMGRITFVAQSDLGKGGTWDGTVKNLRFGWSPAACFRDGSESSLQLARMGAWLIEPEDLESISALTGMEQMTLEEASREGACE